MASVEVTIPSVLNRNAGERKVSMEADTLKDAIDNLVRMMGNDFARRVLDSNGKPKALINIYINGKNARFSGGLEARLSDGDRIVILPAVAGGSYDASMGAGRMRVKELGDDEMERYSRQIMLDSIGYEGQLRLRNARVCITGAGGLGSPIAMQLTAMGVGYIRLVDRDVVELSNLHRQVLYTDADIGHVKVEAAARRLRAINPNVEVEPLAVSIHEGTADDVINGCDIVIDGLDSIDARYALNDACLRAGVPYVYGGALGTLGSACTVLPGRSACIRCIFPELSDDEMPTCSIEGVHPSILYIVSAVQVSEAVRIITGQEPVLLNRLLYIDLNDLSFSTVEVSRNEGCVCSNGKAKAKAKANVVAAGSVALKVEELCGRDMGKRTFSITPRGILALDLDELAAKASSLGFREKSRGEMGITLVDGSKSLSVLKSGAAVVVGAESEDDALRLYSSVVVVG
ncbi:MAG: ThiF family adenylyltransferase [Candidatus Nitrosocaldus sp.]|nr:ThiF family adenylyltransferase [Candidatus Nitrosocaldus sp.]